MMSILRLFPLLVAVALSGCGGNRTALNNAPFIQSTAGMVSPLDQTHEADYRMGVGDKINVRVFQVPDLSFEELIIDTSGNVQMPLIGPVRGSGRTADEMSADIALRLGGQYLRDPDVTVTVVEAASQKVTVDGAVAKPGVYVMRGQTTLLQAVAMAEGPTGTADLHSVAVFRTTPEGRMVAVFDLRAIRDGRAADPILMGDDVVVVDTSRLAAATQQALLALPGLAALFRFW